MEVIYLDQQLHFLQIGKNVAKLIIMQFPHVSPSMVVHPFVMQSVAPHPLWTLIS